MQLIRDTMVLNKRQRNRRGYPEWRQATSGYVFGTLVIPRVILHEWIKYVGENGTTGIKRKINTIIEDARIFIV
jgi:hypothetical protein